MTKQEELREKAEKIVKAKSAFYISAIVFSSIALVLLMLSFYLTGIAFWLRLPIPVFMMVLGILYVEAFGFSFSGTSSADWREEEIEKEMARLSLEQKAELPDLDDLTTAEQLELKKLEPLQRGAGDEDYV